MSACSSDTVLGRAFGIAASDRSLERHRHEARRRLLVRGDEATEPGVPFARPCATPHVGDGRYVVIEPLGRGAMGIVLRAYDAKLQREVALKVVHPGALTAHARARMLREARAMARLSHPNVVAIYDAELDREGGVAVAMELVRGRTLRDWFAQRRPWRDVVAMFVAAGRGLAAAHAAGVLHRDFKPTNVLVGDDGRLRVTDFGLARTLARGELEPASSGPTTDAPDSSPSGEAPAPAVDVTGDELTQHGALLGTPAYMAPEQHEGRPASPATDQFAFCVSLWEGLTGSRPFELWSLPGDRVRPRWPREVHVPRDVVDAIQRGLAADPAARWPSMDALLAVLDRDRRSTRRRMALGIAVVAALAPSALTLRGWIDRDAPACEGSSAALADTWSADRGRAVESALLGRGLPFAPAVWERTRERLDDYAGRWMEGHREACEATAVRGEQSAEVMDLRMACLQRARTELHVAVDILAHADAKVIEQAHEIVGGLPPLERCDDIDALRTGTPAAPMDQRAAIDAVQGELARTGALRRASDLALALDLAHAAVREAERIDHAPLVLDAALELAAVESAAARYTASEATHRRALRLALQLGRAGAVATAATGLVVLVGIELGRPAEALVLADVALGAAEHSRDPSYRADTHDATGLVLRELGRHAEAEAEHRTAITLRRHASAPDELRAAKSRSNLGLALGLQGRHAEAEAEHRAALALIEAELGAAHPSVAMIRNNLAIALQRMGLLEAAILEYEAAIAAASAALGEQHPTTAKVQINLAGAWLEHGEPRRAVAELRDALAVLVTGLGPDHPSVATARQSLGVALRDLGAYADAVAELQQATHSLERAFGPEHPDVAYARGALASALDLDGAPERAEVELRAAVTALERSLGRDHTDVAELRGNLGVVLSHLGRQAEAEAEHHAAAVTFERTLGPDHPAVATARYNVAIAQQLRGELVEAEDGLRRVLAIREATLGVDHPDAVQGALALGEVLLERGELAEARANLERAWTSSRRATTAPVLAADADFALARALLRADRPRAIELGRSAQRRFAALGDGECAQASRVARWLVDASPAAKKSTAPVIDSPPGGCPSPRGPPP